MGTVVLRAIVRKALSENAVKHPNLRTFQVDMPETETRRVGHGILLHTGTPLDGHFKRMVKWLDLPFSALTAKWLASFAWFTAVQTLVQLQC